MYFLADEPKFSRFTCLKFRVKTGNLTCVRKDRASLVGFVVQAPKSNRSCRELKKLAWSNHKQANPIYQDLNNLRLTALGTADDSNVMKDVIRGGKSNSYWGASILPDKPSNKRNVLSLIPSD